MTCRKLDSLEERVFFLETIYGIDFSTKVDNEKMLTSEVVTNKVVQPGCMVIECTDASKEGVTQEEPEQNIYLGEESNCKIKI